MGTDATPQNVYTQLSDTLFCGDCKAARLLIWEQESTQIGSQSPQHSAVQDGYWYAVHCDYFRRRIEFPDKLERCGAHQKKD